MYKILGEVQLLFKRTKEKKSNSLANIRVLLFHIVDFFLLSHDSKLVLLGLKSILINWKYYNYFCKAYN